MSTFPTLDSLIAPVNYWLASIEGPTLLYYSSIAGKWLKVDSLHSWKKQPIQISVVGHSDKPPRERWHLTIEVPVEDKDELQFAWAGEGE